MAAATAVVLAIVMFAGLGLRVHRLDEQSVWWDDYNSLAYLDAPSLDAYMAVMEEVNAEHVPLYFMLQYGWGQLVGKSPLAVRGFSILMGMLAVALLFWLGTEAFGWRAGAIAASCLALSPFHVFHDQAIRPYSLVVFFSLLSLTALLRATRHKSPAWWGLNFIANMLLVETHLFGVLLLFAEGCFLLVFIRKGWRAAIAWGLCHALTLATFTFFVHGTVSTVQAWDNDLCRAPTLTQYLVDLVADDVVSANPEFLLDERPWPGLPAAAVSTMRLLRPILDILLALGFAAALVLSVRMAWRHFRERPRRDEGNRRFEALILLLIVVAVPVTVLAVLSHLWRPAIFPRYTIFSTPALYVLAGAALSSLGNRHRRSLTVVLLGLLGWQSVFWLLPSDSRTQWQQALARAQSEAAPGDVVLVASELPPAQAAAGILYYNLDAVCAPVLPAHDLEVAVLLHDLLRHHADAQTRRTLWTLVQRKYEHGPLPDFEAGLAELGMDTTFTDYPAMRGLALYRARDRRPPPKASWTPDHAHAVERCFHSLTYLAMRQAQKCSYADAEKSLSSLAAMKKVFLPVIEANVGAYAPPGTAAAGLSAFGLLFEQSSYTPPGKDTGFTALAGLISTDRMAYRSHCEGLMRFGVATAELGQHGPARESLHAFSLLAPESAAVTAPILSALENGDGLERALDQFRKLLNGSILLILGNYPKSIGYFEAALARDERHPVAHFCMGLAYLMQGDSAAGTPSVERAFELDPKLAASTKSLLPLLIARDYPQALKEIAQLERTGKPVPPFLTPMLKNALNN